MKLETFKEKLRTAVGLAERTTGKNLSLPILSFIKLEASERVLTLKATNLDLGIEVVLPAKVGEPGELMVSGPTINNFLGHLSKDEKVSLETSGNVLTVVTTHTRAAFTTHPVDDFPLIPRVEGGASFTLPARRLLEGFKAVSYAASFSDIKPEIASVYIYQADGDLIFVATDSFRLAEKRIVLESKIKEEVKLIVPIKNVGELMRVLEGAEDEVEVRFNQNQVSLATPGIYLTSRLVDGVFPDYRQIMPTESKTQVVALKLDLLNSFKLATVFTDKLNQITIRAAVTRGACELYSRNAEVGENTTLLEATLEGEDLEASYNVRYILDGFPSLVLDSITLRFNGKNRPLVLAAVGDSTFTYLVMPLNR